MTSLADRVTAFSAKRPGVTALIAGGLSATGFKPLGLWPVMLACLALFIHLLWQAADRRAAFKIGYLFGLGQFTVGLNWIAHAFTFQDSMPHWLGWIAVPLLSVYLAVYPALAALAGWWIGKKAARGDARLFVTILASTWVLSEYLRATLFTGFAWNPLGVIWLGTGVDQLATIIGTYGLGLIAMLAAGGLWWASHRAWRPAGLMLGGIVVIAALGFVRTMLIDLVDMPSPGEPDRRPAVTIVQPNINQNEKYDLKLERENFNRLALLTGVQSAGPRLIFWPEAAVPAILDMEPGWRARIAALMGQGDIILLGGDKFHFKETNGVIDTNVLEGANNSLYAMDAQGRLLGRYDKAHLVPYGEYLPMRPILSAIGLTRLVPGGVDFWPGPGPRTLDLPGAGYREPLKMGVQICYEITFSGQVVDEADRPDFIFNPSNDAWFGTWGPPQHLAQARLRAIEEGLPVIRSTPTGISAVVDATGHVSDSIGHHEQGAIHGFLPSPVTRTIFSRGGNVIPIGLAIVLLLSAVAIARRKS
ncbi:MAG: apolipoprotein N-acyltransferase [Sphingobium sp.]|nr:apolipoprotein N-acyltransferase [Sphingobium sp.]